MKKVNVLFIGAGRMAEAIISGLLKRQREKINQIVVTNRSNRERLEEIEGRYGVTVAQSWQEHVPKADVILLAMPPDYHPEVLTSLAPHIQDQLVATVAGGMGLHRLEKRLPSGTAVAWLMPNTAAHIGESISPYTLNAHVTAEQKVMVEMMVEGIGKGVACSEQEVHDLTAITGSAPAFIYRIAELLEESARDVGMPAEQAHQLVAQMIYGAGKMLIEGEDPAYLRDQVASPGGSTAAGLGVLEKRGLRDIMREAVQATNERARELTADQET
ncbi:pyrroline-5-carboxylate reductase [Marininema halotolerans]|uniref:Pyrroline-5-carboxylate reductase n=1 Tax=Marininema halotolerans TaxID=1155944 RepID=A0A1I6UT06_9BACL|nr:pyrroline-5-carboxylate reductase [Marininema halotolerans]SFT04598.1 pyrroline-5-carboxylate reductase [Marininema halotolerans]